MEIRPVNSKSKTRTNSSFLCESVVMFVCKLNHRYVEMNKCPQGFDISGTRSVCHLESNNATNNGDEEITRWGD